MPPLRMLAGPCLSPCGCAGCIFMANRAFLPAVLMWATLTPALYKFSRYCDIRYGSAVRRMPLETAAAAPKAAVDPALYLAPALRCAHPCSCWPCLIRAVTAVSLH